MKFTVSTSFYKRGAQVSNIYNQVKNQTYNDWEWVVTDDFSSEKSAKEALLDLAATDSRIKYFEQTRKKELFYNGNRISTGSRVVVFDSDDFAYPKTLEVYNHFFLKHPEVMGMSCEPYITGLEGQWVGIGGGGELFTEENTKYNFIPHCRSWRNVILEFDDGKLQWFQNDTNVVRHVENLGKWLHLPRVLCNYTYSKDSFSRSLFTDAEILSIEKERRFIESKFPHLNNPDKITTSLYYLPVSYLARDFSVSSFNTSKTRNKILYIKSDIKPFERSLLNELFFDHDLYYDFNLDMKFDNIVVCLNVETLNNIENIHAKLRDNHLGTEVIIKYDDHYKLNWDEVSSRLNIFGGYSWRKFGYETFIQPVGFGIFH